MFHWIAENERICTRRDLLKAAGALTIGASLLPASQVAASPAEEPPHDDEPAPLPQIGILMGTFARATYEERLDAVKACGLDCVQLSMGCVGLPPMPDQIAPDLIGRIGREAKSRDVTIVSLEGTFNMSHPDAEHRRTGLRRLAVMAAACRKLGVSKIHLCTGTRDPRSMWRRHPENDSQEAWHDMTECVRAAVGIAEQEDLVLAFEPEVNNVVDSAKKARRLLDHIGSAHLKVTIDAANIFHAGELARMNEILDEAFELIGNDIALAHAKDLSHDGDAGHEPAGHGKLDYDRYLSLLHTYGYTGPLLLHGLSEAQVPGCVEFLREKIANLT